MGKLVLIKYTGDSPTNEAIQNRLRLHESDYSYVVTTTSLELKRSSLAPGPQRDPRDLGKVHLLFHRMLRLFMARELLTRAEERVLIQRAAQAVANHPEMAPQLKQDVFAWRDALALLAEQGLDLSNGLSPSLEESLVSPGVGQLLQVFQREYRALQEHHGRHCYEEMAYDYLAQEYLPAPTVVMEGFTFLKPLQKHFIRACLKGGSTVHFLYPGRDEQESGFAAVYRTAEEVACLALEEKGVDVERTTWETPRRSRPTQVAAVQECLFSNSAPVPSVGVGEVTLTGYSHRHQEIRSCLASVKQYLEEGVDERQLAIVVRTPYEFQTLLEEEAKVQGIRLGTGPARRQLLLTPVGRFILTLYQIWAGDSLDITADQFESILASGWLGAGVQATAHEFRAVRDQFFAACRRRLEWDRCLDKIEETQDRLSGQARLSSTSVGSTTVQWWRAALARVDQLCRRLFESEDQPINNHMQLLLDELSVLTPDGLRQAEIEVLERIRDVMSRLTESTSLPMQPAEFGEVLNSLVREYEELDDGEEQEPEEAGRVWVTTPEAIDGYEKDFVFYLGVDDRRVPKPYMEPWPFYSVEVDRHKDNERYLFLAVARAANQRLHYSYSSADQTGTYRASLYLGEVRAVVDTSTTALQREQATDKEGETAGVSLLSVGDVCRSEYQLTELAHFRLCPFRYALERLDKRSRRYRNSFQARLACEAAWLHEALAYVCSNGEAARGTAKAKEMYHRALATTREVVEGAFPAFTAPDWAVVEGWVRKNLDLLAIKHEKYSGKIVSPRNCGFSINLGGRAVKVGATPRFAMVVGKIEFPLLDDVIREEWLLPGGTGQSRAYGSGSPAQAVDRGQAQLWFRQIATAAYGMETARSGLHLRPEEARVAYRDAEKQVRGCVERVEKGEYPRCPGKHCSCCSAKPDCLGLEGAETV